ncbi:MAG: DUF2892 domain-containing protein [Bacteroidota bacterium]
MKANMGSLDRLVRLIIAVAVGVLYYMRVIEGTLGIVLLVVAAIFLLTSLVSFCPLYPIFKLNTKGKK